MDAKTAPRRNPREILDEVLGKRSYLDLTDAVQINPVVVARGGYGDVFEGQWIKDGSPERRKVAVKRMRIHLGEAKFTRYLAREISVWSGLNHPNILPFCGYLLEGNYPSLISEWMENGTVRRYLERRTDLDLLPLVIGIAEGLRYLHGESVIHSDLKAENVLISDDELPRICDFGISRITVSSQTFGGTSSQGGIMGSLRWMSKELLETCEPPNTHSMESDIWAFGMTVYELLTKELPFFHLKNDAQVMLHIFQGNQPLRPATVETWPVRYQKLWDLCQTCWDIPGRRCGIEFIVSTLNGLQREEHSEHSGHSVLSDQHIPVLSQLNTNDGSSQTVVVNRLNHMHLGANQPLDKTLNASRGNENLSASHSGSQSVDSSQSTESDGADPAWAGPTENTRHKLKHRDAVDTVTSSELGRQEWALQTEQRITEDDLDRLNADLANTLRSMDVDLPKLGRHGEALETDQRAVEVSGREAMKTDKTAVSIWEGCAQKDPDRFNPYLANSLHRMGVHLSKLGRREEALDAFRKAVPIQEALAQNDPGRFNPGLANSLHNMGVHLSKLGKHGEALEALQRAVSIRDILAENDPDKFNEDLANSLHRMGVYLSYLGEHGEALEALQKAVSIRDILAGNDPDKFNEDLANSLNSMGVDLSKLGRYGDALEAFQNAVSIQEALAQNDPDRLDLDLANSLHRMVAQNDLDRLNLDLANSLHNIGAHLSKLGKHGDALEAFQKAVSIQEALAQNDPDGLNPGLANSLHNMGVNLSKLGRHGKALEANQRAVAMRKTLAQNGPDRFNPDLASSLQFRSLVLKKLMILASGTL